MTFIDNFPVTEESLLREYHEALKQTAFYRKDLKYAKAVACARLISVLQVKYYSMTNKTFVAIISCYCAHFNDTL